MNKLTKMYKKKVKTRVYNIINCTKVMKLN